MKIIDCAQNTPEWHAARLGIVTGSNIDKIITPTGQKSTQSRKYMNQLIAERITGKSADTFAGNPNTRRGKEYEQEAAEFYAMTYSVDLTRIGFCTTDDGLIGCSPDYLIGEDELLEIKTGLPDIMVDYYTNPKSAEAALDQDHRPQTQCGLFVTGRKLVTTMLYHPDMKPVIIKAERNLSYIISMQTMLDDFHKKMAEKIAILRERGYMEAA